MNISLQKTYPSVISSPFAMDVIEGLSSTAKSLPCKWFYDEAGSQLFEAITKTTEYYPTRVETRLLEGLVDELVELIPDLAVVIEPGSGSSLKTRILLASQPRLQTYMPIDISETFLLETAHQLRRDFPQLAIKPLVADFTADLQPLALDAQSQRMVFFPGSTIGNFAPTEAKQLLRNIHHWAGKDAWLLMGVDMTQDAGKLLAAYNDAEGITARFNRNILVRANLELEANFDIEAFEHKAIVNQVEHRVEMHLASRGRQAVELQGHTFYFEPGESIHTENCYKYTQLDFEAIARDCGWGKLQLWQDDVESSFGVFLFKAIN